MASLSVMLLDNLQEAGVVDIAVLLQLLDLIGDIVELRLQLFQAPCVDLPLGRF